MHIYNIFEDIVMQSILLQDLLKCKNVITL